MKVILLLFLVSFVIGQTYDYFSLPARVYPYVNGWYNNAPVKYYTFFSNSSYIAASETMATTALYALVTGFDASGNPNLVPGQHNIADTIVGMPSYSDLWQIFFVTVPSSYVANTIMDATVVTSSGFNITKGPTVNCPMVPIGSSLEGQEKNITLGWYQNKSINYIDFGPNPSFTVYIYVLPNVAGQYNIIPSVPGNASYSAFWNAKLYNAPSGYVANSYKSQAAITMSGLGAPTDGPTGINCPVVWVGTPTASAPGSSTGSGSVLVVSFISMIFYLIF